MKHKTFLLVYATLLYLELVFGLLVFDSYFRVTIFNVVLFLIPVSAFITIVLGLFKEKVNKVMAYITCSLLGFWFSLEFIFKSVFQCFFSFELFKLSDQALAFGKETILAIIRNFYAIILFFIPLILLIVFRNKIEFKRLKPKKFIIPSAILVIGTLLFFLNINLQKGEDYSSYDLYFKVNDVSLNVQKLGVINAGMLDFKRTIFGFEEKMIVKPVDSDNDDGDLLDYDYNNLEIDFSKLTTTNSEIQTLNEYMASITGTKQNKYTGLFEGKNLIYITAESFSEIAVSEELTPTLYKMINQGFSFKNYYSSNNLSTIGGEFQSLTGLYANYSILGAFRGGNNSFPMGLGTMFKNAGYNTYAYHDHYYTFQDRNKYLKALGFDNFKGCYNGLENVINCNIWPESDSQMMEATITDYIDSEEPFMAYYMTVSGHFEYDWYNSMANKHRSKVEHLPYSEEVKAYIATQIELDEALEVLVTKLEEKDKLDDTVFVLLTDHYPYGLTIDQINEVSTYKRDDIVEVNSNNLIIWNNKLKSVTIEKPTMSIDVIPTVYNLFGLDYDSRLFAGKDIFSSADGLALFKNRSWVTDKGTYYAATNKVVSKLEEDLEKEYITNINSEVSNRMNISRLIVKTNYYKYLLDNGVKFN